MKLKLFKLIAVFGSILLLTACGAAPASSWPAVTTDGLNVYLSSGSHIYSVNVSSGVENTLVTAEGNVPARFPQKVDGALSFFAPAALGDNGQLLIGNAATKKHQFYSVDPKTGAIAWTFEGATNTWIAGALIMDQVVFAPAGDGYVYLLDQKTGAMVKDPVKLSEHSLWATPATNGELVYVVTMEHEVVALDKTGEKAWSQSLDTSILASPLVLDGTLYVGTISGKMFALDASSGEQKWNAALQGNIWGTPASDGTNLYIGTVTGKTGKFYALNLADGAVVWQRDDAGSIIAGPAVTNGLVLYGTELGKLQALDASGAPKWQAQVENAHFYTTPLVSNDSVLIAPMNAEFVLVAYDLNGVQRWTFDGK
jgi:outer membrane protein assembly factor BamB